MSALETLGLLVVVLPLSVVVYCVVAYWPERRPSGRRTKQAELEVVDLDTDSNT